MIEEKYKIILPFRADSINDVVQFGKSSSDLLVLKKKWENLAIIPLKEAMEDRVIPQHFKGMIYIKFYMYFEQIRRRDTDNYALMTKGIVDAMTKIGLLADDDCEHYGFDGVRLYVDKEDRPRVELEIIHEIDEDDLVDLPNYDKGLNTNQSGHYSIGRNALNGMANEVGLSFYGSETAPSEQVEGDRGTGNI